MQGSSQNLVTQVMKGNHYYIPVYQRRYSWVKVQVERLVDDLRLAEEQHRPHYFLGSLILDATVEGINDFSVIDGQQRITTISLFLMAIRDTFPRTDETHQRIDDLYLIDKYDHENVHKNRLHSVPGDEEEYVDVLENGAAAKPSLFRDTYVLFQQVLKDDPKMSPQDWLTVLEQRLVVMSITVQQDDDAQLIFESLNSTGLDLTEADKIRNFLLMDLHGDQQKQAYAIWQKNEKLVGRGELSKFFRHYLTSLAVRSKITLEQQIYDDYRRFIGEAPGFDRIDELRKESQVAKYYSLIKDPQHHQVEDYPDPRARELLIRLGRMNNDITTPYFLQLFKMNNSGRLTGEELSNVLAIILSYLARRLFVGSPSTGLNTFFGILNRQVEQLMRMTNQDYVTALGWQLTSRVVENKLFPTDQALNDALAKKDYYHYADRSFWFVFDELNNVLGEHQDLFDAAQAGHLSIEHIMPQTLSEKWRQELGHNWELIYNQWDNRFANLTLTGFNSRMSNRLFQDKRDMENGYQQSGIKLNQNLAKLEHWNETTLKARERQLYNLAVRAWPRPAITPTNTAKHMLPPDWTTLEANVTITDQVVSAYRLFDQPPKVAKNWKAVFISVALDLWALDPTPFYRTANSDDNDLIFHQAEISEDPRFHQFYPLPNSDLTIRVQPLNNVARLNKLGKLMTATGHDLSDISVKMHTRPSVAKQLRLGKTSLDRKK